MNLHDVARVFATDDEAVVGQTYDVQKANAGNVLGVTLLANRNSGNGGAPMSKLATYLMS
jgi:hypothetical protein